MSDCRFGVSPVNYPDPDPGQMIHLLLYANLSIAVGNSEFSSFNL